MSEMFSNRKLVLSRLLDYGFTASPGGYTYTVGIMDGEFSLTVFIDSLGTVGTSISEIDTGEEYFLYKTSAQGPFVGRVRDEADSVLADIADKCYVFTSFSGEQTLRLVEYAMATYGDVQEFPWKDTPTESIIRRHDSGKWYAALLAVPRRKLGIDSDQTAEIVNLHAEPERVAELLVREGFYPGWHMNKRRWFTVILDGTVPDAELFRLLDESYILAKPPKSKKAYPSLKDAKQSKK